MKNILKIAVITTVITLVACSSPEAEAIVDYHDGYIKNVSDKVEEIDTINEKSLTSATYEQAYAIQKEELLPIINAIKEYMHSNEPEDESVTKYHNLRLKQVNTWIEGFEIQLDALEKLTAEEIFESELNELIAGAQTKISESFELAAQAEAELESLVSEYNLEVIE
ncbi:hypothetical protein JCM21714_3633 [Gracilibacillus boraciitolerans JCM 21714]|uniref:Lipoprotein n=1 Tax=Gracilibacillus boraciitolerans JCM 21714 TaxID=1298598 RepID=W4VNS3_9BACI|nr:hypothetical protein [Gracilibacillus boraciitolerans]GAE94473.1 hypothetical protein JCM21714_3633 [Gracilibacillus boraciitolerans JCM 21714]